VAFTALRAHSPEETRCRRTIATSRATTIADAGTASSARADRPTARLAVVLPVGRPAAVRRVAAPEAPSDVRPIAPARVTGRIVLGTKVVPVTVLIVLGTRVVPVTVLIVLGTRAVLVTGRIVLGTRVVLVTGRIVLGTRAVLVTGRIVLGTRVVLVTGRIVPGTRVVLVTGRIVPGMKAQTGAAPADLQSAGGSAAIRAARVRRRTRTCAPRKQPSRTFPMRSPRRICIRVLAMS
jgi:hypothetical protein